MITINPLEAASFAVSIFGAMQKIPEFAGLIDLVQNGEPKIILEIGAGNGGSTWAWTKISGVEKLIVIDLPNGPWGNGKGPEEGLIDHIASNSVTKIVFIAGNSANAEVFDAVKSELATSLIDFLFIDGDHSYAGVKTDFLTYSPLVRDGGLIAFHDICEHNEGTGCEVKKFWDELKESLKVENYAEFIAEPTTWGGIGVLKMDRSTTGVVN